MNRAIIKDELSFARLDRKGPRSRVLCGACGYELAFIDNLALSSNGPDLPSRGRVLYLDLPWQSNREGIYILPTRVIQKVRIKGLARGAAPRHENQLLKQWRKDPTLCTLHDDNYRHYVGEPRPGNATPTYRFLKAAPRLPLRMECYHCGSIQHLVEDRLEVHMTIDSPPPYREILDIPVADPRRLLLIEWWLKSGQESKEEPGRVER